MKDIFKKTLSLFACLVLVGQTLLTSVVTAVEVGVKDGYLGEEGTILEEHVATEDVDSDAKVLAVEKVQDLGEAKSLSDELKVVDVAKNLDDTEAGTATTSASKLPICNGTENVIGKILKDYLKDKGIDVKYHRGEITIYYDNDKIDDETKNKYVEALENYRLVDGNVSEYTEPEMRLWEAIGKNYLFVESNITELIDLFLSGKVWFSVNGECELWVEFSESEEPEVCMDENSVVEDLGGIISSYLGEENVNVLDGEIVINNERGNLINYVVTLIDYRLADGNVSGYTGHEEMRLWEAIGTKYELTIGTVSELIDLLLFGKSTFTVKEKNKDCVSYEIKVRFGGNHNEGGNSGTNTCEGYQSSSTDNLRKLAEILNKDKTVLDNNFSLQASGSNLYLAVNDDSVKFNSGLVESIIEYLLDKKISPNDEWGFLLAAMSGANLEPGISTVSNLIDILLDYPDGLKAGDKVAIHTNGGCFYLIVVKDNGNPDSSVKACSKETIETAMDIVKNAVNEEINNKKISRIRTSIEGNKLVLTIDSDKNLPDLIKYVELLINSLLGGNDTFWSKLESKGFSGFNISYVTRLIDVNLGTIYEKKDVIFNDCKFDFQLEFRTANTNPNGDNNPNNNSYSGGGSSGRGGSSSSNRGDDEDIILGGEVSDSEKVCSIEGSIYSDEENQAYIWACKKGIVAADNIMDANLTNPITRAELDKMLSVYATKLLGMNHVIEEEVTYPDVNDSLGDLAYYIQEGYKLQIMGIHANGAPLSKFLPYSLVTRGEFGTVFSRILYGNGNNIDGDNYYEKHLQLLKNANILQNTDHSLMELRGWILLMLYRSQKVKESNGSLELEEVSSITAG